MKQEQRWIELDNFKRQIFIRYELRRHVLTSFRKARTTHNVFRAVLNLDRRSLPRFASPIQQANRCFLSGRKRSISKLTRLSRFRFQSHAYGGKLPAFMRSSW